jgi:putative transposase
MPIRSDALVTDYYYHIFNRGINRQTIFLDRNCYKRALEILEFYSYESPGIKYSKFLKLSDDEQRNRLEQLRYDQNKLVEIVAFCFMPNHFHLLLKQLKDNGISRFVGNFQNSFTRYVNTKTSRIGPILQGEFKSVLVRNDSQLLHLSRYIHLNPYSSGIISTNSGLITYPWSSYYLYLDKQQLHVCNPNIILSQFTSLEDYRSFVEDRAGYQQELELIKHLVLENE